MKRLIVHRLPPRAKPINLPSHIFYDDKDGVVRIERLKKAGPDTIDRGWFSAHWKDTWGVPMLQCWWDEPQSNEWGEVCP